MKGTKLRDSKSRPRHCNNIRQRSLKKIGKVKVPLLLVHGEQDSTTAVRFGRMIYDAANEPKVAHFIAEAGHNDLMEHGLAQAVTTFLDRLPVADQPALRALVASPAMLASPSSTAIPSTIR